MALLEAVVVVNFVVVVDNVYVTNKGTNTLKLQTKSMLLSIQLCVLFLPSSVPVQYQLSPI